jgi:cation:H+ antiporter
MEFDTLSLPAAGAAFAVAAVLIAIFGVRLAREADRLADVTGMGEALMGGVFLGGITSLSGTITSITAAWNGQPDLAVGNALGGIAVQTVFLAVADMAYRRANLEHAASSLPNLLQGALLVSLLSLPLLALAAPPISWFGVHPVSVLLIPAYVFGMRMVSHVRKSPMWKPQVTAETRQDTPGARDLSRRNRASLWARFAVFGVIVGFAGYLVAKAGSAISAGTGMSQTLVGVLFTATCTSLPELITAVAAVRRGALTLAVGGIIGGNCFDVLFLTCADFAYRGGSIYHAMGSQQVYVIALALLLTGILMMGMLRREKHGIANIGFESVLIILCYVVAMAILALHG